jgi:predicted transcriptional regulator
MATTQGIKLDQHTRKRLKTLAAARNRSSHWLMRAAIADYLDREERAEREKREDMKRWKRYQLTGKTVPRTKAAKWLGSLARGKAKKCPK